jgi:hypothetical protein
MLNSQDESRPAEQSLITIDTGMNARIVQRQDTNLDQEIFTTTADKAKLVLIDAMNRLELRDAWQAPFGILVALLAVLPVSTFHDLWGMSKDTWLGIFITGILASLAACVRSFWRRRKSLSIEQIVENLRRGQTTTIQPAHATAKETTSAS